MAAASRWQFVLTDLNFIPVGEILNAKERQISLALNKYDNLSFKLRLDNPLADTIINDLAYIKAYRNGVLVYFGPIIGAEEAADSSGATVAVTSAGAAWNFTKRFIGTSASGGAVWTTVTDRAEIARQLIDNTNWQLFGSPVWSSSTGVLTDAVVTSGSAITYTPARFKSLYDAITELATGSDAFDWRVLPVENYVNGAVVGTQSPLVAGFGTPWVPMGRFVAAPLLGQPQTEAIFEWGTGRNNVKSYSRIFSRDTQANYISNFTSAGPDAPGYPSINIADKTAIQSYRMLHDVVQSDITDYGLRTQLANEHIRVRKNPRTIIKFEPHIDPQDTGNLPSFGQDYNVGDFVRFRAAAGGKTRIDAWLRIWGVQFSVDDNGIERASAILAAQDN